MIFVVSLKSDAIVKHDFRSANIVICQWLSVSNLFVPPSKDCRMVAMYTLSCFHKHLLRLVEHHLSFRDTMCWSSTGIIFNDKSKDWSKIAIGLLDVVGLREYFKFLPQLQYMIPISEKALQSRHWCFAQFSQSSKISVWFMLTSNCCFSSLNLLISCFWLTSSRNCSLCWCFSNISLRFVTLFLSPCILQVHRWDRHTKYSVISSVASGFPVALRILLRFQKWSCFLYK